MNIHLVQIHLMRLFPGPKNRIMRGPGVLWISRHQFRHATAHQAAAIRQTNYSHHNSAVFETERLFSTVVFRFKHVQFKEVFSI